MINLRMDKLIAECDKHVQRMSYAYIKMALFMPLDISRYQQLSDDEVEPKQASEALNAIYAVKPALESIYQLIKTRYVEMRDSAFNYFQ